MSLRLLLRKQTIMIDDHHWGAGEIKDWDDSSKDIHIDKKTQTKINGKKREVQIRLPLNSDKKIKITSISKSKKAKLDEVPRVLRDEITNAFQDKDIRKSFIQDLILILENYSSNLDSLEKANNALKRLSNHFDLKWTNKKIVEFINDSIENIENLERIFTDDENQEYYISINNKRIRIGSIDEELREALLRRGLL